MTGIFSGGDTAGSVQRLENKIPAYTFDGNIFVCLVGNVNRYSKRWFVFYFREISRDIPDAPNVQARVEGIGKGCWH